MSVFDVAGAVQTQRPSFLDAAQGGIGNAPGNSLQAFAQALEKSQANAGGVAKIDGLDVSNVQRVQFAGEVPVAERTAPTGVATTSDVPADQAARQRAIDGLDLDVDAAAGVAASDGSTGGQSILDGLSRIRGAFDSQLAGVNDKIMNSSMDVTSMMQVHANVVQYSLLVDVSSKLAGKTTQAVDTLMKGQ